MVIDVYEELVLIKVIFYKETSQEETLWIGDNAEYSI